MLEKVGIVSSETMALVATIEINSWNGQTSKCTLREVRWKDGQKARSKKPCTIIIVVVKMPKPSNTGHSLWRVSNLGFWTMSSSRCYRPCASIPSHGSDTLGSASLWGQRQFYSPSPNIRNHPGWTSGPCAVHCHREAPGLLQGGTAYQV